MLDAGGFRGRYRGGSTQAPWGSNGYGDGTMKTLTIGETANA